MGLQPAPLPVQRGAPDGAPAAGPHAPARGGVRPAGRAPRADRGAARGHGRAARPRPRSRVRRRRAPGRGDVVGRGRLLRPGHRGLSRVPGPARVRRPDRGRLPRRRGGDLVRRGGPRRELRRRHAPRRPVLGVRVLHLQRLRRGHPAPAGPRRGARRLRRRGRAPRRRHAVDLLRRPPRAHHLPARDGHQPVPGHGLRQRDRRLGRSGHSGERRAAPAHRRRRLPARRPRRGPPAAAGVRPGRAGQPARLRRSPHGPARRPAAERGRPAPARVRRRRLGRPVRARPVAGHRGRRLQPAAGGAARVGPPDRRRPADPDPGEERDPRRLDRARPDPHRGRADRGHVRARGGRRRADPHRDGRGRGCVVALVGGGLRPGRPGGPVDHGHAPRGVPAARAGPLVRLRRPASRFDRGPCGRYCGRERFQAFHIRWNAGRRVRRPGCLRSHDRRPSPRFKESPWDL
ncbi:hypothetical protein MICRO116_570036 [Micrococcus sp. 116]|nr:hypothetical protein MICRO116_570036 [Micrococcus sp. 116]